MAQARQLRARQLRARVYQVRGQTRLEPVGNPVPRRWAPMEQSYQTRDRMRISLLRADQPVECSRLQALPPTRARSDFRREASNNPIH